MAIKQSVQPAWLTYPGAVQYTGLSIRTVERRVADGTFIATHAKPPGGKRGRRLISKESIDRWLDSGMGESPEMPAGMNGFPAATQTEEGAR